MRTMVVYLRGSSLADLTQPETTGWFLALAFFIALMGRKEGLKCNSL